MKISAFRKVGVGIAANNKELVGDELEIGTIEWSSFRDGELTDNPESMEFSTTDAAGNAIKGRVAGNVTIKATWYPNGSNRRSAPHVRRGTQVEIHQAGDEDKFYWTDMGFHDHLKKLETIIFAISATNKEQAPGEEMALTPENTYWFEFSSHSKKLAFSSAKANGEPYLYEMFFDFDLGQFTLKDDIGNFVHLDSAQNLIHLENSDKCWIKLTKKDMDVNVPQDLSMLVGRDMTLDVGKNLTATIGQVASVTAGTKLVLSGGGSVQTMQTSGTTLVTPDYEATVG